MQGVLAAKFAEFFLLKLFRRRFLVDKRDVIAAFALCALKTDYFSHVIQLQVKEFVTGGAATSAALLTLF